MKIKNLIDALEHLSEEDLFEYLDYADDWDYKWYLNSAEWLEDWGDLDLVIDFADPQHAELKENLFPVVYLCRPGKKQVVRACNAPTKYEYAITYLFYDLGQIEAEKPAPTFDIMEADFLPKHGLFPFGDATVGVINEREGGIVAYFNSKEAAMEYIRIKEDKEC